MRRALFLAPLAATLAVPICADEGMWTFDNPPTKLLQERYQFTPTQQWLDHVRLSCVRMNDGGSGSFVSANGLVLTNHHVARGQLQKNSTREHDYLRDGFYAATPDQEMKSPDLEVNVLVSLENVTARVNEAVGKAKSPKEEFAARRAVIAEIERESQQKTGLRSDVVTLYQGGEYWLYRYRKYTDVRLVFAPEQQAAFFGGDSDNFTYPRYDLDMALFRVYDNGKPLQTKDYLKWNLTGAADKELVFVAGHPGSTKRLQTTSQLELERDITEPAMLNLYKARIAVLRSYSTLGPEQARQAGSLIFSLENSQKAYRGRLQGLLDKSVMDKKLKEDADFKARVIANAEWKAAYGGAWDAIAAADSKFRSRAKEFRYRALNSALANIAQDIVQYVAEIKKPDGERLNTYHDAQLDTLKLSMFSPARIYPELEIARMAGALQQALSELGPNDPFVKAALAGRTPQDAAAAIINNSKLADPAVRKQLVDGGEQAVAASTDPLIVQARQLDPLRREFTHWMEDNVTSVEQRAGEQLGKARFAVYGRNTYPDATFTLRLSYGAVEGYPMNGTVAPPKTTFFGLFDRAASFNFEAPFNLPARYSEGRDKLNLSTPLDFVTTNDIIGGNSGSPVINRAGELVGLVFDGNIESLVGDFVYDPAANRTVAVHSAGMAEALRKLYNAPALVKELFGE
ncbi:MAG TPA: S46 family peptidase [Verrucomicrobiae bacterium]|nr:S46 family peptidase [Verrucomicrobiae bacterium]